MGRLFTYMVKAAAGHYRGVGNTDTNVQSNYADLRQPNTKRTVTPSPVSSARPKSTARR